MMVFIENEDTMSQSGWSYYKSVDFRVCFATIGGKDLARGRKPIRHFVKYPLGFRGCGSVININYEKLVNDTNDIAYGKGRDSPCVKFALKAHLINISDTLSSDDRRDVIK